MSSCSRSAARCFSPTVSRSSAGEPTRDAPVLLGELAPTKSDASVSDRMGSLVTFAIPFDVTGQPAISLPLHWTDLNLPIGVQLAAAYGREDVLLRVSAQLEQAAPWRDRHPPMAI